MTALPDRILRPHPDRFPPTRPDHDLVLALHATACLRGADGYVDPSTGAWVFTAAFLDERGTCCDQGCRHCPWIVRPSTTRRPGGASTPDGEHRAGSGPTT